jgi:hypothetical protein
MNIPIALFRKKTPRTRAKRALEVSKTASSALERELSRNGVLSEAKAGGANLADRMRENLKRFGGAQGTGRTCFLLWLVQKASPYTLKGQGIETRPGKP